MRKVVSTPARKSGLSPVTLAVMAALHGATTHAGDASAAGEDTGAATLQEVTVTATRREAVAQDLPMSITAVSGDQLEKAGIQDMSALAHSMAGVSFIDKGPFGAVNGSSLIIRGLNSEATSGEQALATPVVPPVATYVDDTPLYVNLRLDDLDHVEILRGPQGTLYGSGSLGGTIRFVQNAPDPTGFDTKASIGAGYTDHAHGANGEASGMINLPLGDTVAVRMNASWSEQGGFIKQPDLYVLDSSGAPVPQDPNDLIGSAAQTTSANGTNLYTYRLARIAALWKPSETFKAQLSYYYQLSNAAGYPVVSPTYGVDNYASTDHTRGTSQDEVNVLALTLTDDLGFATLTSNTSFSRHDNYSSGGDLTGEYASFSFYPAYYGQNPRVLVTADDQYHDRPWAEEIRLASKGGDKLDWVGGLFFRHEDSVIREHEFYPGYLDYFNACATANPDGVLSTTSAPLCGGGEYYSTVPAPAYVDGVAIIKDQAYIGDFETTFKDMAAFGELTWHILDPWSVTAGSRVFKQDVSQSQQTGLLFVGPSEIANNALSDTWRRALWKLNTAWQLDATNLVYATWSQGFRRGGVNALPPLELGSVVTDSRLFKLAPDTADNYEIGFKGTIAGRFRYSADIFDIQWHNVQEGAQLTPLVLPGAVNVGNAYSRGFETELFAAVTSHLSTQLDYTYNQTKITSYNPWVYPLNPDGSPTLTGVSVQPAPVGTALPGTPRNSMAGGFTYGHVPLAGAELSWSVNAHYQSAQQPSLSVTAPVVHGYTMVDTRLTLELPHWTVALYCNNLTDQLGLNSWSDPATFSSNNFLTKGSWVQAVPSTPRTVGFTLAYALKD